MLKTTEAGRRNTVDIDTRRNIVVIARALKPQEVAEVGIELSECALKDKMGWPSWWWPSWWWPADSTAAAREMASFLVAWDKEIAAAKAKAREEQAAKDAAVRQDMIDAGASEEDVAYVLGR